MELKVSLPKKNLFSKTLIDLVEKKYLRTDFLNQNEPVQVGDILRIGYKIPEGDKERIQFYEGLVISISNRTLGKSMTVRRNVQGVGIEQVFLLHSPKIASITKKQSSKVRRAKLYFIRELSGKSTRLKIKR
jgi:large subunit ribosomal protein L19